MDLIDDFGNVSNKTRRDMVSRLKKIKLNVLQVIIILLHHNNIQLKNRLVYYLKKNADKFDNIARLEIKKLLNNSKTNLSSLITFIDNTEKRYEEDNIKRAKDIFNLSETRNNDSISRNTNSDNIGDDFIQKKKTFPLKLKNCMKRLRKRSIKLVDILMILQICINYY